MPDTEWGPEYTEIKSTGYSLMELIWEEAVLTHSSDCYKEPYKSVGRAQKCNLHLAGAKGREMLHRLP